ncbi:OmpA family protein [Gaetbulibacter sp. M240]|uniref:OmpA family protein n=1 Tax=Gaetbulibacter sp. M240 TaxID=3126511 RepID=UPI00374FA04C
MKTIKLLSVLFLIMSFSTEANAQLFKKLKNKIEKAAEETVIDKVEDKTRKETGKAVDTLLNGKKRRTKKETKNRKGEETEAGNSAAQQETLFEHYSKFDFVPGDEIKTYEDFSEDNIGDLPAHWNTSNSVEVVGLNIYEGNWAQLGLGKGSFVPDFMDDLPENFTLEYDLIIDYDIKMGGFKPVFFTTISDLENPNYDLNDDTPGKNGASFLIYGGVGDKGKIEFYKYATDNNLNSRTEKDFSTLQYDSWTPTKIMHVSIWKQGKRLRVYLDEEKVFDLPRAFEDSNLAKSFRFFTNVPKDDIYYYLSNIRFAEGKSDIRSKLLEEGKLVTYGITFDTGSAVIKQESFGVLKEVASVLKSNKDLRVKVIGHTDAVGDTNNNLKLSQERAQSVVNALTDYLKVPEAQLETEGKGETELLAEGNSPSDHAKNRRVEFNIIK